MNDCKSYSQERIIRKPFNFYLKVYTINTCILIVVLFLVFFYILINNKLLNLILGQQCILTYKHFTAIQQLAVKLQDTLELTEEQLDVALSKVSQILTNYQNSLTLFISKIEITNLKLR